MTVYFSTWVCQHGTHSDEADECEACEREDEEALAPRPAPPRYVVLMCRDPACERALHLVARAVEAGLPARLISVDDRNRARYSELNMTWLDLPEIRRRDPATVSFDAVVSWSGLSSARATGSLDCALALLLGYGDHASSQPVRACSLGVLVDGVVVATFRATAELPTFARSPS